MTEIKPWEARISMLSYIDRVPAAHHEVTAAMEAEIAELRAALAQLKDDPDCDGIEGANPAWWRGHDHTSIVFCKKVNEILDGKDDGHGAGNPPWEPLRRRLLALEQGEPVAWMDNDGNISDNNDYGTFNTPLFTNAMPEEAPAAWLITFENGEEELHFENGSLGETQEPLYLQPQPAREPMPQAEAEKLAHRRASVYAHRSDPSHCAYTFLPHTLMDFVHDIEAGIKEKSE